MQFILQIHENRSCLDREKELQHVFVNVPSVEATVTRSVDSYWYQRTTGWQPITSAWYMSLSTCLPTFLWLKYMDMDHSFGYLSNKYKHTNECLSATLVSGCYNSA